MWKKVRNFLLKAFAFANFFSLIYWASAIDAIISWQPWAIMAGNFGFLMAFGYANGIFDYEE